MRTSLLLLLFLFLVLPLSAQICDNGRYQSPIFSVDTTLDIVYGNAPAIPLVYVNENVTVAQDLKLDLYQPAGDTLARRPLFLFAFGGGFLIGAKEDEDARSLCDSFARKGYVTAAINYRLNMNVADGNSAERAVYRAVQDWSAAIRYCKEFADSFRIDTNMIFAGGVSAGSISAMHCQYMDESQRPASTYSAGLPFPRPDLGCKDCSGNNFAHSSQVRALVNAWGAIGDTLWIDPHENIPMLSFHGDLDPVVPYGFGLPFTALFTISPVYGSSLIARRQTHLGFPHQFVPFPGEGHNVWGTVVNNNFVPGPTQHWDPILDDIESFLWDLLVPDTGPLTGNSTANVNDVLTYSVPLQANHRWCWDIDGGTIVSANPAAHSVDVRWDQAGTRQVQVQAISHLDAVGPAATQTVIVGPVSRATPGDHGLSVYPSISQGKIRLHGCTSTCQLTILDSRGQQIQLLEANDQTLISTENWPSGMYYFRLRDTDRTVVKKVWVE